ncbi:MAG: thymidine kinase [Spirochaetota bacterium]
MNEDRKSSETESFLKSLGFPEVRVHHPFNHFDFKRPSRRILVIGPMGSGKTEYSARVWRDSLVALRKSETAAAFTRSFRSDRRNVFFIRSFLDKKRFPDYPDDALAYRGGFERCGDHIAQVKDSFEFEKILKENPEIGTWIIDEASFFDERLAYIVKSESEKRGLIFIFPTLVLNFRKDIFNPTARLLLEIATDVFPLTAYCEHKDCLMDGFYTYRYYTVDDSECPALYFDPLIVIGGDRETDDPKEPNYCTRCDTHHYLPGKEYTFLFLKPLGEMASGGNIQPLEKELYLIKKHLQKSSLYEYLKKRFLEGENGDPINMNALQVPCIAEKALLYLYCEQNLLSENQIKKIVDSLNLDKEYLAKSLADNRRPLVF